MLLCLKMSLENVSAERKKKFFFRTTLNGYQLCKRYTDSSTSDIAHSLHVQTLFALLILKDFK